MARQPSEKKTCLKCGKEYAVSSFYSHRNPLINEQFGFCKKCVKENVDLDDMDTMVDFLRTMDIPYFKSQWKVANDASTETVGTYFKNINSLKQNQEKRFKDSDDLTGRTNRAELTEIEYEDFEVTETIVKRWGRNLQKDDYMFLQEEFDRLAIAYGCDTPIQENIYKNMARTQWLANTALDDGDVGKFEKLMNTLSKQMNDANLKPVQDMGNAQDNGLNDWGSWVKKIEETEPIPEASEDLRDVDGIKKYVDRWFVTQIKRVFGMIKDEDIVKLDGED
ncbi:TPA: hypothetical protein ACGXM3_005361 [Bacillus cereus]